MARSDMPWVVGLAARLVVRRNSDTAGTLRRASSSRLDRCSTSGSSRTTEKAASAAAVLLGAGAPGKRFALPNARVLIHQPAMQGDRGTATDLEIHAQEINRMRVWMEETLASLTNRTPEEVSQDIDRDKFLSAEQALEYGLVDEVLASRKITRPSA